MFVCSKCKREFKRESNMKMHLQYCNGILKNKDTGIRKENKEKTNNNKKPECIKSKTGKHELDFLNKNIPIQAQAIAMGYSAFCRICKELV